MLISIIQNILPITSAFSGIDTLLLLPQTAAQKHNHTSWSHARTNARARAHTHAHTHAHKHARARAARFKFLYLDVRPLFSWISTQYAQRMSQQRQCVACSKISMCNGMSDSQ